MLRECTPRLLHSTLRAPIAGMCKEGAFVGLECACLHLPVIVISLSCRGAGHMRVPYGNGLPAGAHVQRVCCATRAQLALPWPAVSCVQDGFDNDCDGNPDELDSGCR